MPDLRFVVQASLPACPCSLQREAYRLPFGGPRFQLPDRLQRHGNHIIQRVTPRCDAEPPEDEQPRQV